MRGRDPRCKLAAFALLLPVLMTAPIASPVWMVGVVLVLAGLMLARVGWQEFARGLWRLRWLWLAMLLIHGWFTPGTPLWPVGPALTGEGVLAGGRQAARMILLIGAAWSLMRSTTPMELVGALQRWSGGWRPAQHWLSLLAFCLATLPRLQEDARRVRIGMRLRLAEDQGGFAARLERIVFAGEAMLMRMLWDARRREQGLLARGHADALPLVRAEARATDWRDWVLLLPPAVAWLIWWAGITLW